MAIADTYEVVKSRKGILWLIVLLSVVAVLSLTTRKMYRQRLIQRDYEAPPEGMVLIPAGNFLMGSDAPDAEPDEKPLRTVFLPAFYIDRHEVTNREFQKIFPDHPVPKGQKNLPVTAVFKWQAEKYCKAVGKRLPTNAEWEKAARGTDGRRYPWGNDYREGVANLRTASDQKAGGRDDVKPNKETGIQACALLPGGKVEGGKYPGSDSPYGVQDMAGNVWEWVADEHSEWSIFSRHPARRGILRGGAYGYGAFQARTSYQGFEDTAVTCNDTGFRCAMDAIPR